MRDYYYEKCVDNYNIGIFSAQVSSALPQMEIAFTERMKACGKKAEEISLIADKLASIGESE